MVGEATQLFRLEVDGVDAPLRVERVRGEERIHAPFRFEVLFRALDADGARVALTGDDLLAKDAKLSFVIGANGEERTLEGVLHDVTASHGAFEVVLVPRLALLAETADHRVYVDQDAATIIEDVLGAHGLTLEKRLDRSLEKRPQCVQAFETDLDFLLRLAAEEGASLHIPWDDCHKAVLVDNTSGHDDAPAGGTIRVADRGGLVSGENVHHVTLRHQLLTTQVSLRDYDFTRPTLDQAAAADSGSKDRERYEYPGFYADPAVGADLAKIRLEAYRARSVVLTGKTGARRLLPGYVVTLEADDGARSGRFLLLEVTHDAAERGGAAGQTSYEASFVAIPADTVYRPPRPKSPRLGGIQTATVTGPAGGEIHTEEHGRVKVHLRWDRKSPMDDTSSTWARVVQPPTSGGFFLPRTGWEVLLSLHERSADDLLVVGRLYNGTAVPPSSLPGKKVVSAFGTLTTPGGGSTNGVSMDDSAGSENMSIVASKDLNDRTENDKNIAITANDTWTIGANATTITGQVYDVTVGGAQSYSVGATREVNVTANKVVNAASETVMVGGARIFDIGGDHITSSSTVTRLVGAAKAELGIEHVNRAVQGTSTTLVGGTWSVVAGTTNNINVSGASTELVGGAKSIRSKSYYANVKGALGETFASRSVDAGGDRQEGFGAAATYRVGGSGKVKGSDVTVTATARIVLDAGGVKVTITPGSIEISGDFKSDVAGIDDGKVDYE